MREHWGPDLRLAEMGFALTPLRTLNPSCYGGQHAYAQGDGDIWPELARLLFCANCGDVIKFELPVMEETP